MHCASISPKLLTPVLTALLRPQPKQSCGHHSFVIPGVQRFKPTSPPGKGFNVEPADMLEHESDDTSDAVDALMEGDGDGVVSFGCW